MGTLCECFLQCDCKVVLLQYSFGEHLKNVVVNGSLYLSTV